MSVKTLEGENTSLGWSTQKKGTVLYVFTPACHWCKSNLNNIKSLAATQSDGYRFVGLSLTDKNLKEYLDREHLPFPAFIATDRKAIIELRLGSTPQTLVILPSGKVAINITGAYKGKLLAEVENFFSVHLPGALPLENNGF